MHYLKNYSSGSSTDGEDADDASAAKPTFSADYFHLDDSSDGEDEERADDSYVRVYIDTFALSTSDYGPERRELKNDEQLSANPYKETKFRSDDDGISVIKASFDSALEPTSKRARANYGIPSCKSIVLKGHSGSVSSLEWSGAYHLLSSSLDGKVFLWDTRSRNCTGSVVKIHKAGVKKATWFHGLNRVLSVGFDKTSYLTDVTSGKSVFVREHAHYVTSVQINEDDKQTFLTGSKDCIFLWDLRSEEPVSKYKSSCGQVLDILMLPGNQEFVCSTELVSRDSADKTLMVWDLRSTALLSNQIYPERYTCPCLRLGPTEGQFLVQSNAGYIAIFSTKRPYKLDRYKRYEGHKVMGYNIGFDLSKDKKWIVTGDAEGLLHFYNTRTTKSQIVGGSEQATVSVAWNPHLGSTVAVGTWDGDVQLWC